jgi:integrase
MTYPNFRQRYWMPLFDQILPFRTPHVLRHTLATWLLQNGEPMTYVKDQLGHSSIKITVDVYGHLMPGSNKLALDRLEDLQTRRNQAPRNRP